MGLLFHETEKLISEPKEITGVCAIGFKDATWMSTSLLCEKAFQIISAKTCLLSDSVLCVRKWEMILLRPGRANRSDGMPSFLEKIQSVMTDLQCETENFKE